MNKKILFVLSISIFLACSKKEVQSDLLQNRELKVDPKKIEKLPTTIQEKELVENLSKVSEIIKELYKDKKNIKLVNAAIFSKAYTDESVLIKDLIYPEISRLTKFRKFNSLSTSWNVSLNEFSKNFWSIVKKNADQKLISFLEGLKPRDVMTNSETGGGDGNNASIYFPYSEEFVPSDPGGYYEPLASVAAATADADEGIGSLPYYIDGVFQYYITVLVNDDYAFANPTHIVGVNGIEALEENTPTDPPPPPLPPPGVNRVYIGEVICKVQYDRLISFSLNGGGSEVKYCRASGYLQPVNGQVTSFQDIASVDFTRGQIRRKNWSRVFIIWDPDWNQNNSEQVLCIYEEDTETTRTFSGTISTALDSFGIPLQGSINYSINFQSKDDIIRQLKITRHSYYAGAFIDQGMGFSDDATFLPLPYTHGWPAYEVHYDLKHGANVGWTWPYNSF